MFRNHLQVYHVTFNVPKRKPHQCQQLLRARTAENLPHPKRSCAVASCQVDPELVDIGISKFNQRKNLIKASEKSDNLTASVSMQGPMKSLALNVAIFCKAASPTCDQGLEEGGGLVALQAQVEQGAGGRGGPGGLERGQRRNLPAEGLHQDLLFRQFFFLFFLLFSPLSLHSTLHQENIVVPKIRRKSVWVSKGHFDWHNLIPGISVANHF